MKGIKTSYNTKHERTAGRLSAGQAQEFTPPCAFAPLAVTVKTLQSARERMEKSKSIAGLVGPTLIVMVFFEMSIWNPTLYDTQIVPLIYLNGVLLFVTGLVIVKSHNIWTYSWQTLVTMIGYIAMIVGVLRMLFPQVQKAKFNNNNFVLLVEAVLILIGIFITFKAYVPTKK